MPRAARVARNQTPQTLQTPPPPHPPQREEPTDEEANAAPVQNASTGKAALAGMQKLLQQFGASSFGCMEDFDAGEVIVQFKWRERSMIIKASGKGYAAMWLRRHPWTYRMRTTKQDHERKALRLGQVAVYSILRDWLKGKITAVEVGMLSFEGAFLVRSCCPMARPCWSTSSAVTSCNCQHRRR